MVLADLYPVKSVIVLDDIIFDIVIHGGSAARHKLVVIGLGSAIVPLKGEIAEGCLRSDRPRIAISRGGFLVAVSHERNPSARIFVDLTDLSVRRNACQAHGNEVVVGDPDVGGIVVHTDLLANILRFFQGNGCTETGHPFNQTVIAAGVAVGDVLPSFDFAERPFSIFIDGRLVCPVGHADGGDRLHSGQVRGYGAAQVHE